MALTDAVLLSPISVAGKDIVHILNRSYAPAIQTKNITSVLINSFLET
jgi:hypothetical protein